MKKVDMSSEAITKRLRQVDQLRELSLSLMKGKKESDRKKLSEKEIFGDHGQSGENRKAKCFESEDGAR